MMRRRLVTPARLKATGTADQVNQLGDAAGKAAAKVGSAVDSLGAAAGKGPLVDQAVQGVEDLGFAPAAPVRAEVAALKRSFVSPPSVVQSRASAWVYLRPADLSWDLYSRILTTEESR